MDLIVHSSIIPTRHKNVQVDRATILYTICDPSTHVDLASLMFPLILAPLNDTSLSGTLPYGILITLLDRKSVV